MERTRNAFCSVMMRYIIEAESMEEAVVWAEKGRFMVGSNEIRQVLSPA